MTVNFDDPGSYHFYFGDREGAPGTLPTFFACPDVDTTGGSPYHESVLMDGPALHETGTHPRAGGPPDACGPGRWLCALRTFRAVVRERGFTAAARRLGVSQGAVSQQLRCLEAQFGVRLLERSAHRVALTPAGERLLWHAERLLAAQDAMLAEMADLRPADGPAPEILR